MRAFITLLSLGILMFAADTLADIPSKTKAITIFLCGDVMTGRGIDQVLPHAGDPSLHESYVKDARKYVELAEKVNGFIQKPVDWPYIWGDAIEELKRVAPDIRIINLETSVTTSNEYWRNKGIHYRMQPQNIPVITAAKVNVCALANNHLIDWGYSGLLETLESLKKVNVLSPGAGRNHIEAESPAAFEIKDKGRVIIFSCGLEDSGIPQDWAATSNKPGVFLVRDLSNRSVQAIKRKVDRIRRRGDIFLVSIHWGGNWGYAIPSKHRKFAHQLIDEAGIDVIHGHSSHHPKGIEIYQNKPIIYGCGDFLNDYEGIGGYTQYRSELTLMYFVSIDPQNGDLVHLQMTPMKIQRLKLNKVSRADALWLKEMLDREGKKMGTQAILNDDNTLILKRYP